MIVVPDTLPLFKRLNEDLTDLLRKLKPEQWGLQTIARLWKVKDVASHLVDGNLRRIAMHRDGWMPEPDSPVRSHQDLVGYLNTLNAEWVRATRRLSPAIIIDMLEYSNREVFDIFSNLDPGSPSLFPVSWAGESVSTNHFDLAREYTERWLHQQQIRDTIGDDKLLSFDYYHTALDIFLLAWPFTMNDAEAEAGTLLKTNITGRGGGQWYLLRSDGRWNLAAAADVADHQVAAETTIEGQVAWKLFTKSVRASDIEGQFGISGNSELASGVLNMISVMA